MSSEVKYNLAIFASGNGSNANQICAYFQHHPDINVKLIVCNKRNAGVSNVASNFNIESLYLPKHLWPEQEPLLSSLQANKITHIILAGFLLLIPDWLINHYRGRIVNIHPALLPKFGGKGMYGMNVHERVKQEGELVSGITIHSVDEHYDEGDILLQASIELDPEDSASEIAAKVLRLEHFHYPRFIEKWICP